jgi:hypothetical protein
MLLPWGSCNGSMYPWSIYKIRVHQSTGISTAGSQFRRSGGDVILPASYGSFDGQQFPWHAVAGHWPDRWRAQSKAELPCRVKSGKVWSTSHCSIKGCAMLCPFPFQTGCIVYVPSDTPAWIWISSSRWIVNNFWYCDQHLPASSLLFKSGSIRSGPEFRHVSADCTTSNHLLTLEHVPKRLVGSAGVGNGRGPSKWNLERANKLETARFPSWIRPRKSCLFSCCLYHWEVECTVRICSMLMRIAFAFCCFPQGFGSVWSNLCLLTY